MLARSSSVSRPGYNAPMDLWDDGSGSAAGDETLSVRQVASRIQAMLKQGFPRPFWLVGEASEWDRTYRKSPRGHWYFRVVDDEDHTERRASLGVKMWKGTIETLFGPRGRLRGRIQPADGVVLRMLVRPDFWPPAGQISFTIEDIDPEHTLGNLDRQRRELLARLQAEGASQWNKQCPLPDVPLRIGLVTSAGSAAHEDVLQTLLRSGYGFQVLFCDARTQGIETVASVPAAIAAVVRCAPDVLLLVRGGGSRLDLSWFDREEVARAVAACRVPVITGIGHEIDISVADLMAHTACRTPTAAAECVLTRVREAAAAVEQLAERMRAGAERSLAELQDWLGRGARALIQASRVATQHGDAQLQRRSHGLQLLVARVLDEARHGLLAEQARLTSGAFAERLDRWQADLAACAMRLGRQSAHAFERAEAVHAASAARLRLLDPRSVLARGYAYLRRADGSLLMDAARARPGELLTAVLRDGELDLDTRAARLSATPEAGTSLTG